MGSVGAGRSSRNVTAGINITEGMTIPELNTVAEQLANRALELQRERDGRFAQLSADVSAGRITVDEAVRQNAAVIDDYNRRLEELRALNRRMTTLYNISVSI